MTTAKKTKTATRATPYPPPLAEVRVNYEFKDPQRRADVSALSKNIVAIFETIFYPDPFMGRRPFVVLPSTDGMPRANIGEKEYNVIVTCLDETWLTRLAYQLGHELGHFWIGPGSSSMLKECVCTMMSFICIDELAKQWKDCPATPAYAALADNMRDYHDRRTVEGAMKNLGLADMEAAKAWVKERGPVVLQDGHLHRDEEQVMSRLMEGVLRRNPGRWEALKQLGNTTDTIIDATAFRKWRDLVAPNQKKLVEDIAASLATPIRENKPRAGK